MKGALSIRAASTEYGIPRPRLAGMVQRGEIAADTSRPGLVLIPRGELERAFNGTAAEIDLSEVREMVRTVVRDELARFFGRLTEGG